MTEKPKAVVMPEDRICTCGHEQSMHTDEGRCDAIYCKGCDEFKQDFSRIEEGRKIYFAKELDVFLKEQADELIEIRRAFLKRRCKCDTMPTGEDEKLFIFISRGLRKVEAVLRGGKEGVEK